MLQCRCAWILGTVLLAACHGDASNAPLAPARPVVKKAAVLGPGPSAAELTAGMVEAVTVGKSTLPVDVKYELARAPVIGQAFDVTIALMPHIEADPAVLVVTGSDALLLSPGSGPVEIPTVEPAQVYRLTVTLTPAVDGVQLLALKVSLKHDDAVETREFSIPIIVGAQ